MYESHGANTMSNISFVAGMAGVWGVLAVGLFATSPFDMPTTMGRSGVFHGKYFTIVTIHTPSDLDQSHDHNHICHEQVEGFTSLECRLFQSCV